MGWFNNFFKTIFTPQKKEISSYICEYYVRRGDEMLLFSDYIYAFSEEEAKSIMKDIERLIGFIHNPKIVGRLVDVVHSKTYRDPSPYLADVILTNYFIVCQLDRILKYSLLEKKYLEKVKNDLIENEDYELVAVLHRKLSNYKEKELA